MIFCWRYIRTSRRKIGVIFGYHEAVVQKDHFPFCRRKNRTEREDTSLASMSSPPALEQGCANGSSDPGANGTSNVAPCVVHQLSPNHEGPAPETLLQTDCSAVQSSNGHGIRGKSDVLHVESVSPAADAEVMPMSTNEAAEKKVSRTSILPNQPNAKNSNNNLS